jgi:hypothetical protein
MLLLLSAIALGDADIASAAVVTDAGTSATLNTDSPSFTYSNVGPENTSFLFSWGQTGGFTPARQGEIFYSGDTIELTGSVGSGIETISSGSTIGPDNDWWANSFLYSASGAGFTTFDPQYLAPSVDPQYLGIRLTTGGSQYYGWIEITDIQNDGSEFTVASWVYSDVADTPVLSGQNEEASPTASAIPEPGTAALLAGAFGGLLMLRRRLSTLC